MDLEEECDTTFEYTDRAIKQVTYIQRKREQMQLNNTYASTTYASTSIVAAQIPPGNPARFGGPCLPRLDITIFEGALNEWLPFWEQYEATIHVNQSLTPIQKFHYQWKYLSGYAASAVAGLPTTEACYQDAIDLRKQRFEDRWRIEEQHLHALRSLPQVQSSTNLRGLQSSTT